MLKGAVIAERYRLDAPLGRGGHAEVWRAIHVATGGAVAVKLVRPSLHQDPTVLTRFDREARETAALRHPNTVRVLDFGRLDDDTRYLVMELVDGVPLDRRVAESGPLAPADAVHVAAQILRSLGEAHARGLVHRDLKPENVLVTGHFGAPDFVKVVDFGVCRRLDGVSLTTGDALCGTPRWMAPEQWLSAPVDARTDLYAVGALLFYLMTARPPFDAEGSGPEVAVTLMNAHLRTPPPALGAPCPPALAGVVARLLAKRPADRPRDAAAALDELLAAAPDDALEAATPVLLRAPRPARSRWLAAAGAVAGAAALFLAGRATAPPRPVAAPVLRAPAPAAITPAPGSADELASVGFTPAREEAPAVEAPADAPAVPETTATPEAVRLALESRPTGASVRVVETDELLAPATPASVTLGDVASARLARGEAVTLEFRREGHRPERRAVTRADVGEAPLRVDLARIRTPASTERSTPTRTLPPLRTP